MITSDFNWLPHSLFKGIKYPKINYVNDKSVAGYYSIHPNKISNIIYISMYYLDDDTIASTIAHEFCHYLQHIKDGKKMYNFGITKEQNKRTWHDLIAKYNYDTAIKLYFTQDLYELEALHFEYKYSKDWVNELRIKEQIL